MRNRFRAGDTTALGEAYDEHANVLFRYAMRVCGDQAAAEDVVSATFLEAWRCRERLRPEGDGLRPWLLGIATNILRGTAREARRRDRALARLADRGVLPDFADDVVTRLHDTEQLNAARAALKRLRRRDREVFALVVWAGLDYASAGEALGIPTGTVRSRLSRARDRLRALADAELKAARKARHGGTAAPGATRVAAAGPREAGIEAEDSVRREAAGTRLAAAGRVVGAGARGQGVEAEGPVRGGAAGSTLVAAGRAAGAGPRPVDPACAGPAGATPAPVSRVVAAGPRRAGTEALAPTRAGAAASTPAPASGAARKSTPTPAFIAPTPENSL